MKIMAPLASTIPPPSANAPEFWGQAPTATRPRPAFHAPTPPPNPPAKLMRTMELKRVIDASKSGVSVGVLVSKERTTIPGARWMRGVGYNFQAAEQRRFTAALEKLTGGDRNRPV